MRTCPSPLRCLLRLSAGEKACVGRCYTELSARRRTGRPGTRVPLMDRHSTALRDYSIVRAIHLVVGGA